MGDEQHEHQTAERPATERAEDMLNRLGQRFNDMRTTMGRALEQRAQQPGGGAGQAGAGRPATETLEVWGERVGYAAGLAGHRLRQWGARAREEAEDLWAEAQSVRQQQPASAGRATGDGAHAHEHTQDREHPRYDEHAPTP